MNKVVATTLAVMLGTTVASAEEMSSTDMYAQCEVIENYLTLKLAEAGRAPSPLPWELILAKYQAVISGQCRHQFMDRIMTEALSPGAKAKAE